MKNLCYHLFLLFFKKHLLLLDRLLVIQMRDVLFPIVNKHVVRKLMMNTLSIVSRLLIINDILLILFFVVRVERSYFVTRVLDLSSKFQAFRFL